MAIIAERDMENRKKRELDEYYDRLERDVAVYEGMLHKLAYRLGNLDAFLNVDLRHIIGDIQHTLYPGMLVHVCSFM